MVCADDAHVRVLPRTLDHKRLDLDLALRKDLPLPQLLPTVGRVAEHAAVVHAALSVPEVRAEDARAGRHLEQRREAPRGVRLPRLGEEVEERRGVDRGELALERVERRVGGSQGKHG